MSRLVGTLLQALHNAGAEQDRAGNRQLFYDQYATLVLLYFFTPTVTNLRGVQQLSLLAKVQQRWGIRRTAVGSLSEAATVFEAALLQDIISELALRASLRQKTHHQICLVQIYANVPHITSPLVVSAGHEKEGTRCTVHPPIRARSPSHDAGEGSAGHTVKRGQLV
jgi:hypothetical protein